MTSKKLDLEKWQTQQSLANEMNTSVQRIHNWIKRGKIQSKKIKGSRLILVDKSSIITDDLRKTK
jgi:predicted site-specific integrase-resolvase